MRTQVLNINAQYNGSTKSFYSYPTSNKCFKPRVKSISKQLLGFIINYSLIDAEAICNEFKEKLKREAYKYSVNTERLNLMSNFKDNWDGQGAVPFSKEVIEKAKKLIETLQFRQPTVVPTTYGSVQIEFEKSNGDYLQINVFNDDYSIFYSYTDGDNGEKRGSEIEVNEAINNFLNRNAAKTSN